MATSTQREDDDLGLDDRRSMLERPVDEIFG